MTERFKNLGFIERIYHIIREKYNKKLNEKIDQIR